MNAAVAATSQGTKPTQWQIDPAHSAAHFSVRHLTREPQRDEHLRSADFFDVVNHPAITFRSKQITAAGSDHFKLTGDLTIRGVTKEVTFNVGGPTPSVKDPWGNVRAA